MDIDYIFPVILPMVIPDNMFCTTKLTNTIVSDGFRFILPPQFGQFIEIKSAIEFSPKF